MVMHPAPIDKATTSHWQELCELNWLILIFHFFFLNQISFLFENFTTNTQQPQRLNHRSKLI